MWLTCKIISHFCSSPIATKISYCMLLPASHYVPESVKGRTARRPWVFVEWCVRSVFWERLSHWPTWLEKQRRAAAWKELDWNHVAADGRWISCKYPQCKRVNNRRRGFANVLDIATVRHFYCQRALVWLNERHFALYNDSFFKTRVQNRLDLAAVGHRSPSSPIAHSVLTSGDGPWMIFFTARFIVIEVAVV